MFENRSMSEKTDPEYWFLSESDMPNDRKPSFTSNNNVIPFIDGEDYMRHLSDRLSKMNPKDMRHPDFYLHLAGWRVSPQINLVVGGLKFENWIKYLISEGVIVRAMLWYFTHTHITKLIPHIGFNHPRDNTQFVELVNKFNSMTYKTIHTAGIQDNRVPKYRLASHHQKHIILRSEGIHWAYIGGIDIAVDRWDTQLHNNHPNRVPEFMHAWHDVHCCILGPAVVQIWQNFAQRWNDRTPPVNSQSPPTVIPKSETPDAQEYGTHHVQLLRTLACGDVYSFAPRGEMTVQMALLNAIEKAEHYIYIEEQYLWPCRLVDKLKEAINRKPDLKIILVLAKVFDLPQPLKSLHIEMRVEAIRSITGGSKDQVFVYHLEQLDSNEQIYVHSKLMIIDDRYVSIGSANITRRSMTTDSELTVGIVDAQVIVGTINGYESKVCKFAKDLRIKLWQEHLGIADPTLLDDPIASIRLWPDWKTSKPKLPNRVHHAVCHHLKIEPIYLLQWLVFLKNLTDIIDSGISPATIPPDIKKFIKNINGAIKTLVGDIDSGLEPYKEKLKLIEDHLLGYEIIRLREFIKNMLMNVETVC